MSDSGSSSSKSNKNHESVPTEAEQYSSDVEDLLKNAENILLRNRTRYSKAATNDSNNNNNNNNNNKTNSNTQNKRTPAGATRAKMAQLQIQIDSLIDNVNSTIASTSNSSLSNSSLTRQNEPSNSNNLEENPNNISSNDITTSPNLPNSSMSNDRSDDDLVIFVDETRFEVIDLCTPKVKNRRRGLVQDDAVIEINDTGFAEPGPPKKSKTEKLNKSDLNLSGNSDKVELKCPICMDSSAKRTPTSTSCGHIFCNKCITMAIKTTSKCPLCNKKLKSNQLIKLFI